MKLVDHLHEDRLLKVPRITHDFIPNANGPMNQIIAISRGLEQLGISSPILTTNHESSDISTYLDVNIYRFRANIALLNFKFSRSLLLYLEKTGASLFHIHGWRNPISDSTIILAHRRKIPYVVQAHGVAFGYRQINEPVPIKFIRRLYDTIIKRLMIYSASAVIASTNLEAAELEAYGFPKSHIATIPVGVSNNFFVDKSEPNKVQPGFMTLLTVSRLSPRRNLEQIIRSVAQLKTRGIQVHLRIVGPEVKLAIGEKDGYLQKLKELTIELGIYDIVSFIGPLYGDELLKEYQNADVFLYTSLYENFGQPIAEAAAMGLPIVSTPTGIALDLLNDNSAGYLVPFHNVEATTEILIELSQDALLRQRLGRSARQRAEYLFDWKNIIPRYIELYTNILDQI